MRDRLRYQRKKLYVCRTIGLYVLLVTSKCCSAFTVILIFSEREREREREIERMRIGTKELPKISYKWVIGF